MPSVLTSLLPVGLCALLLTGCDRGAPAADTTGADSAATADSAARSDSSTAADTAGTDTLSATGDGQTPVPELRETFVLASLPLSARDHLEARGCRVPQYAGDTASNVIRGNFFGTGDVAVGVWCVGSNLSKIFVFRERIDGVAAELDVAMAGAPTIPARFNPNAPPGQGYGCIGTIATVPAIDIAPRIRAGKTAGGAEDTLTTMERATRPHDGILDGECNGAATIHYWTGARWVLLPGGH